MGDQKSLTNLDTGYIYIYIYVSLDFISDKLLEVEVPTARNDGKT